MDPFRTILSLNPGDLLLGRYKLIERLGRGAMGEVWKAEDQHTGRTYALKILPPEFIGSEAADKRMITEAAIGEGLSDDGIVRLYAYERDPTRGNVSFLRMQFVEGRDLEKILTAEGPQPLDRVLGWAKDLAAGIDYAHGKKVLHRDIKPSNVMIETSMGKARLLDFGIGREIRNTMSVVSQKSDSSGTPAYMSPQQVMGDNDKSNDIYSLAATLYHALAGRPPFTDGHIQTQILHKPAPPIPGLPAHVNAALLKGLAKEAGERPGTATALAELLATAPKPPPAPVVHPGPAAADSRSEAASKPARKLRGGSQVIAAVLGFAVLIVVIAGIHTGEVRRAEEAKQREVERRAAEQRAEQQRKADLSKAVPEVTLKAYLENQRRKYGFSSDFSRQSYAGKAFDRALNRAVTGQPTLSSTPAHLARKTVELAPGVSAEFVYIDAPGVAPDGFLMGSPASEEDRGDDETQHRVKLTRGYWMQTTEVTQGQWQAVMGSNPSNFNNGTSYPVEQVSWEDCQQFIGRLHQRGVSARLPTEAEWEFACRAGTTTPFSFGATISPDQANYGGNSTYGIGRLGVNRGVTTPAGSFSANAWGLFDMHGNVWEWCQDWYGGYPAGTATDPMGPQTGSDRVLRGGSCSCLPARLLRSAFRYENPPTFRYFSNGFRLTLDSE